ncbi:MAG: hypothetical protein AAF065_14555 [Verrucomicrobiota bacterium]
MSGCKIAQTTNSDGAVVSHYLGYTQVERPVIVTNGKPPSITSVKNYGVGVSESRFTLGYHNSFEILFPAEETNYAFIDIPPGQDFESIIDSLNLTKNNTSLCITQDQIDSAD